MRRTVLLMIASLAAGLVLALPVTVLSLFAADPAPRPRTYRVTKVEADRSIYNGATITLKQVTEVDPNGLPYAGLWMRISTPDLEVQKALPVGATLRFGGTPAATAKPTSGAPPRVRKPHSLSAEFCGQKECWCGPWCNCGCDDGDKCTCPPAIIPAGD
jgi:hypothetical protein